MINNRYYQVTLLLATFLSLNVHSQDMAQVYLNKHQNFIAGIVELKKRDCSKASKLFVVHNSQLKDGEKAYFTERTKQLMSTCISKNTNTPSKSERIEIDGTNFYRTKIRKPRLLINTTDAKINETPVAVNENSKKEEIIPETKKILSYGVKFATRPDRDYAFLSLVQLGTIVSVENNGKFDYYIANVKKESDADKIAENLSNQGFKDLSVYTMERAVPLAEVKKIVNKELPVSKSNENCAVIIHSLQDAGKIQKAKDDIKSAGYTLFTEQVGNFYRIGVSSSCDEMEINILLEKLRKQFNTKAWIRK